MHQARERSGWRINKEGLPSNVVQWRTKAPFCPVYRRLPSWYVSPSFFPTLTYTYKHSLAHLFIHSPARTPSPLFLSIHLSPSLSLSLSLFLFLSLSLLTFFFNLSILIFFGYPCSGYLLSYRQRDGVCTLLQDTWAWSPGRHDGLAHCLRLSSSRSG